MIELIIVSIAIRIIALVASIVAWVRLRDVRMSWLTGLLVFLILRQSVSLASVLTEASNQPLELKAEAFAFVTSLICLGAVWGLVRMIRDRDRAVELMRSAEAQQRALVKAIPDAMFRMARDGTYLSYSGPSEDRLIAPPRIFLGRKATEILPPDNAARCMAAIEAAFATGEPQSYEYDYTRQGGGTRHWESRVVVSGPDEVLVLVRDITERRRIERQLEQTTRDLERAQSIAHTGSWVSDPEPEGRLEWSAETCRIFGIEPKAFDGRVDTFFRHVHPDDAPAVRAAADAALYQDAPYAVEHRIVRADGQERWVRQRADVVRNPDGRPRRMIGAIQDITEQRRAEEALRRSEERYRRLAEHGAVGIWEIDQEGRTLYANPTMCQMLEVESPDRLRGQDFRQFITPESLPSVLREHERRRQGRSSSYEVELIGARGGHRTAVISGAPMLSAGDRLTSFIGTFTDITDRKAAEENLRAAQERYRTLFAQSPYGIMIVDPERAAPIEANTALLAMLGYERGEFLRLRLADFEASESTEQVAAHVQAALERGEDEFESRMRTRDGRVLDVAVRLRVVELDGARRFQTIVRDITEQKKAQELIRSARQRNELLIKQTPLGVVVWDVERRVLEWNPTAERLFGYTVAQALGRTFDELIVPESARAQVARVWQDLLAGRGGMRSTNENVTAGGARILCEWYNTVLVSAEGSVIGVASLVKDVTDVRRLEEELRQSQKMEAVGQLASGVAHDFSNLLTAITGFVSLARRTLSPQHPAVRSLDRVDDAARQAVGVTKALLTFSRGGGGEKRPVQLGATVEDALRLLRRTLPAAVEMRTRLGDVPLWVWADPTQLQQVVMNLIINARDAMPGGGALSVSVGADLASREARIEVTDTGIGMSPDVQSRIFEPFYTTKPPGEGTGLGLSISHAIVKDLGGRIEVVSQLGEGSTFRILVPLVDAPSETADKEEAPPAIGLGRAVCLASGRAYTRELMASALSAMGYQTNQVGSLAEVSRVAEQPDPPLLLVDLDTFGVSPSEAAADVRRNSGRMRVLMLTSGVDSLDRIGDDRVRLLGKPVQLGDLGAAVLEAFQ